ncbi:MAG: hypothetical protein ILP14_14530, partial [Oscillospiraceae bacterium]|nr:hypothetical protein [Oscillospiraceae bacterium]
SRLRFQHRETTNNRAVEIYEHIDVRIATINYRRIVGKRGRSEYIKTIFYIGLVELYIGRFWINCMTRTEEVVDYSDSSDNYANR